MRSSFAAIKVWAYTLLIANETETEVATSYFQKAKSLPCPVKEKMALYLQVYLSFPTKLLTFYSSQLMRTEILAGLIAGQSGEVVYAAPLSRMTEFEQLFQGVLKLSIPTAAAEASNLLGGSNTAATGCGDSHLNSLQCTYYSLKAALLSVTGNTGNARIYAQECISVATNAQALCKICSINHVLALALVVRLYLSAADHIAVFGVLCLMQAFSKMFDSTKSIIWKARNCLPQQYRESEQLSAQPSVNMLATRRYISYFSSKTYFSKDI